MITLYTVARQGGLWYAVLAAPPSQLGAFNPVFQQMIDSAQFPNREGENAGQTG